MTDDNDRSDIETWKVNIPGKVGVLVFDPALKNYRQQRVSGTKGSPIVRLTVEDRQYNQAMIRDSKLDPFTNGMLVRLEADGDVADESSEHTDDHLSQLLAKRKKETFIDAVSELDELHARKLRELAEVDGKNWQIEALDEHLEQYRPGGTQTIMQDEFADED